MPFKTGFKCRFKCGDAAMAELFGHEKLIVYQKGMRFAVVRGALLAGLPKRVAACDHLDRGAESILVNIAHASNLWSPIVSILVTMRKTTTNRVREEHATYRTKNGRLFSHEDLDVYEASLQLSAWVERMLAEFSCSADLLSKLDKETTAIPLNIAEGTGRFSGTDQAKFFGIEYKRQFSLQRW